MSRVTAFSNSAAAGSVPWDRLLPNTNVVSASVLPSCSVSSMNAPPRAAAAPTAAPHSARWDALSRSMLLTNACSWPSTSDTARSSSSAVCSSASSSFPAASKSASATNSGVCSFRRTASPLLRPPHRNSNTNSSSAPNRLPRHRWSLCSRSCSCPLSWPPGSDPPAASFAARAGREATGMTRAASTPSSRAALSATNATTSATSPSSARMSTLFTRNTTFLPHFLMYLRKSTSDSVKGRSADITNSTRSARGTYSSVSRCWRSRMTLVPGVSTTFTSRSSAAPSRRS
mmetsp:Transcript_982/g.3013  ORF Transcript_982/g.3013 Transcript_982/m.3013 type:complete len:288 (-) Transcript_982:356-1219(-)